MSRPKKDGKFINAYVKRELVDRVDAYSESSCVPKTSIIEIALQEYLDKVEQKAKRAI